MLVPHQCATLKRTLASIFYVISGWPLESRTHSWLISESISASLYKGRRTLYIRFINYHNISKIEGYNSILNLWNCVFGWVLFRHRSEQLPVLSCQLFKFYVPHDLFLLHFKYHRVKAELYKLNKTKIICDIPSFGFSNSPPARSLSSSFDIF